MRKIIKHYKTLIFLFLASQHPAYANSFADIEAGLVSDDNLTRTDYSDDIKADSALELFADYGNFYELNNNWSATSSVFARLTNYSKYSQFSSVNYGIAGSARKKLGLGAYSPSIKITASAGINNVQDDNRDSTLYDIGVGWDKRLNNRWQLGLGIKYDRSNAKTSTYDTEATTYYLVADYEINNTLLLNMGISQRNGDIISITNPTKNPSENIYNYLSKASGNKTSSDTVFGSGLTAYNINANTLILTVGLSYALDNNSSINARYENQNSSLPYGISYGNNIYRINYIYSF